MLKKYLRESTRRISIKLSYIVGSLKNTPQKLDRKIQLLKVYFCVANLV